MAHYTTQSGSPSQLQTDYLLVPTWGSNTASEAMLELDKASQGQLTQLMKTEKWAGKVGETLLFRHISGIKSPRILVIGCGDKEKFTPTQFYQVVSIAIKEAMASSATQACLCLLDGISETLNWQIFHAILSSEQCLYRFDTFKSTKEAACTLNTITFANQQLTDQAALNKTINEGVVIAKAISLTKDLGNLPSNVCTPHYLAEQAIALGKNLPNLKVTVLDKDALEKLNMNAFLSVARGSQQPPKLIVLEYQGGQGAPVALVGKGVTFDSGGISLKPGAGMDEMRYDMCGAATVLGCMAASAELKLPINLVGIMACTENMPSGDAYKPGDIVTAMSGKTIEILNTDAEGRVILADALAYVAKFKPELVIDIATLTGAIIIALGDKASGLMTQDDDLAKELILAGNESWDRIWRLPLWDEYQEQIKSNFADMANIGSEGGKSITAACLLSRFAEGYRWAHLDIAGTAWTSGKNKIASGRPVSLLMRFLLNRCK